jgi:GT2 family glycosyltransferase
MINLYGKEVFDSGFSTGPTFNRKSGANGFADISVVIMTHDRKPDELFFSLGSLSSQTFLPNEIIVVDTNHPSNNRLSVRIEAITKGYPRTKYVHRPREAFSLSYGLNVGIQNTNKDSRYIMTTGPEDMFSENVLEWLSNNMEEKIISIAPIGRQLEGAKFPPEPWVDWDFYCRRLIDGHPPKTFSLGTFIIAERNWWFRVRGYDEEHHPFNWADSDVTMRAKMDGFTMMVMPWDVAQVLHVFHEESPHFYGVSSCYPNPEWGIIRNPNKWGDINDKLA